MQGIGQDLRARYEVPKDLPPKLLVLVRKLDDSDWLFPAFTWRNDNRFLAVAMIGGAVTNRGEGARLAGTNRSLARFIMRAAKLCCGSPRS